MHALPQIAAQVSLEGQAQMERRTERRRALATVARLTILEGPDAGAVHEITTRDLSHGGLSFWINRDLTPGLACRIEIAGNRHVPQVRLCEVIRTTFRDNGHEVAVRSRLLRD